MADVKDPKIAEAYEQIRSDKSPLTYLLLTYPPSSSNSNTLTLATTGSGSLEDFVKELEGRGDEACYGYVRVKYANDEQSWREKFVLVVWIGRDVKIMRRARVSVHLADVKQVLRTYSIEVHANGVEDLKEDEIISKLRKAGGANYNRSNFS